MQGLPARQKPRLRRGVPLFCLTPDVAIRIGDVPREEAERSAAYHTDIGY